MKKKIIISAIALVVIAGIAAGVFFFVTGKNAVSKKTFIGEWEQYTDSSQVFIFEKGSTGKGIDTSMDIELPFEWTYSRGVLTIVSKEEDQMKAMLGEDYGELADSMDEDDIDETSESYFAVQREDEKLILTCTGDKSEGMNPLFEEGDEVILVERGTAQQEAVDKANKAFNGQKADYPDEVTFETALNNGEDTVGKTVVFTVASVHPDSLLGFNLWSGEHLNFVSDSDPGIEEGQAVFARITKAENFGDSWEIHYEVISVN
jgi:hypothetical protein